MLEVIKRIPGIYIIENRFIIILSTNWNVTVIPIAMDGKISAQGMSSEKRNISTIVAVHTPDS